MRKSGIDFRPVSPPVHEPDRSELRHLPASQQAEALAYFKARAVAEQFPDAMVIGADTVVAAADGRVLGKPAGPQQARDMLQQLCGTRHTVITGVALLGPGGKRLIASATTYVTMRRMTDEELQQYVQTGEWKGKAGAYAIQETADRFVDSVEGSFSNVVGLPMELVRRMVKMAQS